MRTMMVVGVAAALGVLIGCDCSHGGYVYLDWDSGTDPAPTAATATFGSGAEVDLDCAGTRCQALVDADQSVFDVTGLEVVVDGTSYALTIEDAQFRESAECGMSESVTFTWAPPPT